MAGLKSHCIAIARGPSDASSTLKAPPGLRSALHREEAAPRERLIDGHLKGILKAETWRSAATEFFSGS